MKSMKFKCPTTETCLKMLARLLEVIIGKAFPCLSVVSWGWAKKLRFSPLNVSEEYTWATPMGDTKDVIFQPVRDALAAIRHFLIAANVVKVSETKFRV